MAEHGTQEAVPLQSHRQAPTALPADEFFFFFIYLFYLSSFMMLSLSFIILSVFVEYVQTFKFRLFIYFNI